MKKVYVVFLALFCFCIAEVQVLSQETFQLRRVANSKTFSQIDAINSKLEVIGIKEETEKGISSTKTFFRRGDEEIAIPILKDFTTNEAVALSDTGVVVGYASRGIGAAGGSIRGYAWNSRSKELTELRPLETDIACNAQDISSDGKRITGYSVGNTPARMRPCLWDWQEEKKEWVAQELESILPDSPYLQAGHVIISPDGNRIAACLAVEKRSAFVYINSLFVWEKNAAGKWERKKIADEQPRLKDMNNQGAMVGSLLVDGIPRACVFDLEGNLTLIELLEGDASSIAHGITNNGIVVGLSDDPSGEAGAPKAFIYQDGAVSPLELSGRSQSSAALAINQEGVIAGYFLDSTEEDAAVNAFIRIPGKK